MCLAKAYLNEQDNGPILQDIAHIRLHDNRVELKTLFGQGKVILDRIIEIDFTASKILIERYLQPAASDEGV